MDGEYITDFTKFDSNAYLKDYYSELKTHPLFGDLWITAMRWFHEAFASDVIKGRRLLDVGSGPTLHSVISASAHVDSIFLSDFSPQNIDILRRWLDGTLQHSFESYFKFVVDREGKKESPGEREMMLRQKVSGICKIDLLQEPPLAPSFFPQFDIITTSLCLVAVAENHEMYKILAKRIADMLRIGGHLLLFSENGVPCYKVGSYMFNSLQIDCKTVQEVWKSCGFEIIEWKQDTVSENVSMTFYLMVAKKIKSV